MGWKGQQEALPAQHLEGSEGLLSSITTNLGTCKMLQGTTSAHAPPSFSPPPQSTSERVCRPQGGGTEPNLLPSLACSSANIFTAPKPAATM